MNISKSKQSFTNERHEQYLANIITTTSTTTIESEPKVYQIYVTNGKNNTDFVETKSFFLYEQPI